MGKALYKLGAFCARRSLVMIGIWAVILVILGATMAKFGAETSNDLTLPGTGSQEVKDLLEERFPPQQNGTNPIVFNVTTGKLTDEANKQAIDESIKALAKAEHVYSVTNPISSDGQTAGLLSKDGRTAFAPVLLDIGSGELNEEIAQKVFDATEPAQKAGIDVQAAGSIGSTLSDEENETSEIVGILAAMLILTLVLGSLVAMGLPIISAVIGLLVALDPCRARRPRALDADHRGDVGDHDRPRRRDRLRAVHDHPTSTASRRGHRDARVDRACSRYFGKRDRLRRRDCRGGTHLAAGLRHPAPQHPRSGVGLRRRHGGAGSHLAAPRSAGPRRSPDQLAGDTCSSCARRSPTVASGDVGPASLAGTRSGSRLGALLFLAPLIAPAPSLEFGQEDIGATSPDTTERKAYDLITAGFGVGYNGPLQVASKMDPVAKQSEEYTKKYNQATSLKDQLDEAQKELPKEQKQLEKAAETTGEATTAARASAGLAGEAGRGPAVPGDSAAQPAGPARSRTTPAREREGPTGSATRQAAQPGRGDRRRRTSSCTPAGPLRGQGTGARTPDCQARRRAHQASEARGTTRGGQPGADQIREQLVPLERELERLAKRAEKLLKQAEQLEQQAQQLQTQADELEAAGSRTPATAGQPDPASQPAQARGQPAQTPRRCPAAAGERPQSPTAEGRAAAKAGREAPETS